MGMRSNSINFLHMNRREIELGSLSSAVAMPQDEWKRKRQKQPVRGSKQGRKHLLGPLKETPKSSTRPIKKTRRENLTLFDWMTVYTYVDTLPQPVNQMEVVKYFSQGLRVRCCSPSPRCPANYSNARRWKGVWTQIRTHCQVNDHVS